eukprot:scaffold24913_cov102-Isochrysis_galbana.AAC.2
MGDPGLGGTGEGRVWVFGGVRVAFGVSAQVTDGTVVSAMIPSSCFGGRGAEHACKRQGIMARPRDFRFEVGGRSILSYRFGICIWQFYDERRARPLSQIIDN